MIYWWPLTKSGLSSWLTLIYQSLSTWFIIRFCWSGWRPGSALARDLALNWVSPYLSSRHQHVSLAGSRSSALELKRGIPQGSVLGPVLFSIYTLPGDRKYGMGLHLYADNTQLYLCFESSVPSTRSADILQLESCITKIRAWMLANRLKLNGDKTEFLQFLPNPTSTRITFVCKAANYHV